MIIINFFFNRSIQDTAHRLQKPFNCILTHLLRSHFSVHYTDCTMISIKILTI